MSKLSSFLEQLFTTNNKKKPQLPFLHQTVDFRNYDMAALDEWQTNSDYLSIIERLHAAFKNYLISNSSKDKQIVFLNNASSKGIMLQDQTISIASYKHLIHSLYIHFKTIGYAVSVADLRSYEHRGEVRQAYKYYLKPSIKHRIATNADTTNTVQIFGNITLEVISTQDKAIQLKILSNSYTDQHYDKPKTFIEFVDFLLQVK